MSHCTPLVSVHFSCKVVSTDLGKTFASILLAYGFMFAVALKMFKASSLSMGHASGVLLNHEDLAIMVPGSTSDGTTSELWSVRALL